MPLPTSSPGLRRRLLRDETFLALRTAIVDGTLEPGEKLVDADLCQWLDVSRTPVREAIARLEQTGLVITTPGRSTVVAPLDVRVIRDAQELVASLHELCVREAVPLLTASHLEHMRQVNDAFDVALSDRDVDAAIEADDRFHAVPVQVYANTAVQTVLEQYTPVLRRMERQRFSSLTGRASLAQHDRIIELARHSDADAAARETRLNWLTLQPTLDDDTPSTTEREDHP